MKFNGFLSNQRASAIYFFILDTFYYENLLKTEIGVHENCSKPCFLFHVVKLRKKWSRFGFQNIAWEWYR
jgi:hypothetical protein